MVGRGFLPLPELHALRMHAYQLRHALLTGVIPPNYIAQKGGFGVLMTQVTPPDMVNVTAVSHYWAGAFSYSFGSAFDLT